MDKTDNTFESLMKRDHPFLIHREPEGYAACVPSLGILVSAKTMDECYVEVEQAKSRLFTSIVEQGFGDAMLSIRAPSSNPRPWVRMLFALSILSLLLLTILIPANYVLSELAHRIPAYTGAAMDVVQQRMNQMSDNDRQKFSGLLTRMCPVIDEMVEARCKIPADSAPPPGRKPR